MTFDIKHFVRSSIGDYNNKICPADYRYITTDTLAEVNATDYFYQIRHRLVHGCSIGVNASDGYHDFLVLDNDPLVLSFQPQSLAPFCFHCETHLTPNTAPYYDFTIPGVLTTDVAFCQAQQAVSNQVEAVQCLADTVRVFANNNLGPQKKLGIMVWREHNV